MEAMFTGSVVDLPAYGINPRDVRVFLHSGDFRIDVGSHEGGARVSRWWWLWRWFGAGAVARFGPSPVDAVVTHFTIDLNGEIIGDGRIDPIDMSVGDTVDLRV